VQTLPSVTTLCLLPRAITIAIRRAHPLPNSAQSATPPSSTHAARRVDPSRNPARHRAERTYHHRRVQSVSTWGVACRGHCQTGATDARLPPAFRRCRSGHACSHLSGPSPGQRTARLPSMDAGSHGGLGEAPSSLRNAGPQYRTPHSSLGSTCPRSRGSGTNLAQPRHPTMARARLPTLPRASTAGESTDFVDRGTILGPRLFVSIICTHTARRIVIFSYRTGRHN